MDRTVLPVENLTQRVPIPGFALRDPYMTMGESDVGKVRAWFNASSVVHQGKRWMAYRVEAKRWFLWSRICLCQLDEQFIPIPGTDRLLPLHTRFEGWGAEDPRLFVFNGGLFLTYGDGYRVLLAQLDDDGNIVRCGPVPADKPDMNPPQRHSREKNFGFFEFDGRLFCQYSVNPTVTLEFDPQKWTVVNKWSSPWRWSSPFGDKLHGGAPPIFHDGFLWRWVHCHRTEKLPQPRSSWFSDKPQETGHRYFPHLVKFEPEPPFAPLSVSASPVFYSPWDPTTSDGPTHYSVVYVGSSERDGSAWRLVYGENDCRICTAIVADEDVLPKMVPVEKPKPKRVRYPVTNFLHFIWVQGEEYLAPDDAARVNEWKEMNPDWKVQVWDDETLSELIAARAPGYFRAWEELGNLRERRPTDVALTAKASDMARLILLSIRFGGNQEWNAYADTDTRPARPLTEFLNDDTLYGGNLPKQPVISGPISEKAWDTDDWDLLVTEENLQTPQRGFLTNAVMMARPDSMPIHALLKAGVLNRGQPTLKAWGQIMLRQSIEALKRTPDGKRIHILPFHYFVWNPSQMKSPQPEWSVCSHLNHFRWNQPGVRATTAGSARGRGPVLV